MYKIASSHHIIRIEDNAHIPVDLENRDYQEYLAWLAEGNTPEPADPVPDPRIAEIKAELDALDFKKIRPLAAGDTEYLAILQEKTLLLQDELKVLQSQQDIF